MCLVFGLLLAWASFKIAPFFSPWLIFPLMIGLILGASLVALARLFEVGHRPTIWASVVLSVAVVIVGQHYFSYRTAVAADEADIERLQMARATFGELVQGNLPPRPDGLVDYLKQQARQGRRLGTVIGDYTAKGPMAWLCWTLDGLLIFIPAAVMVAFALRKPYCPQCRSWYATRRGGRLDAKAIEQLADLLGFSLENSPSGGHYWIDACNQGCAPSIFTLSCEGPSKTKKPHTTWLDTEKRNQVTQILDQAKTPTKN